MTDLVERYVRHVGRYMPAKERAEIEAEIRSMIQDKLDDRSDGEPSEAVVAAVLAELGDPRRLAASYGSERYLVGPDLYPAMMMVLRRGCLVVAAIVAFVNLFEAFTAPEPVVVVDALVGAALHALYGAFGFFGSVVLVFALIQHFGSGISEPFDPLALPVLDDPAAVDRVEMIFGLVFSVVVVLALLYFLNVGGLTLRFDLSNPGEVIPSPSSWLMLLTGLVGAMFVMSVVVLRRGRWNVPLALTETAVELAATVALYFAVFMPVARHVIAITPDAGIAALAEALPGLLVVLSAVTTLTSHGIKLVRLWGEGGRAALPYRTTAPR